MHGTLETQPLISVRKEWMVKDAARLMADCSISALGILDDHQDLIGIVTERDLAWFVANGKDPAEIKLAEIANDFPVTVESPLDDDDALRRMRSAHVRHLIVTEDGSYRIVSLRDLAFKHLESGEIRTPQAGSRLVTTMLDAYGSDARAWYRSYSNHPSVTSKRMAER